jgi:hypothetical protein
MLFFDFEKAYQVFSIYLRVPIEDVCPCCSDSDTLNKLNNLELKLLDYLELLSFLKDEIIYNEASCNLAFFLPRILEVSAQIEFAKRMTLLESFKDALIKVEWQSWKYEEIEIIKKYFRAYYDYEPNNPILFSILNNLEINKTIS